MADPDLLLWAEEALCYVRSFTHGDPKLSPQLELCILQTCLYTPPCVDALVGFWQVWDLNLAISRVAGAKATASAGLVTSTTAPGSAPANTIYERWRQLEAAYYPLHVG